MADFERLGVCPEIIRAISEEGWLLPTPVQDEAIPLILGGGDVCVAAETGSGKTGAFGIPCLQIVHETLKNIAMTGNTTSSSEKKMKFKLDTNDKDSFVFVSTDGYEARSQVDRWCGIRSTGDVLAGKYMFEIEILGTGLVRVGFAVPFANSYELGIEDKTFGYGGTGKKSWNRKFEDYGEPYERLDIIGCCLDRESQTISYLKNGRYLGVAYSIPPALHKIPLKPAVCGKNFHLMCNFGVLKYPLEGFLPMDEILSVHHSAGISNDLDIAVRGERKPLCVILEPTRDLAQQTYDCMIQYGKYLSSPNLRIGFFVGGLNERKQKESLQQGVDIAIGTISKLVFFARRRELDIQNLKFLVLDEADNLIKNDDNNEIILFKSRQKNKVQTLFFSATLHGSDMHVAINRFTNNPTWVDLKGKPSIPETVHFVCYKIDPAKVTAYKRQSTCCINPPTDGIHGKDNNHGPEGNSQRIKLLKPQAAIAIADALDMKSCLVFCRTNLDCNNFEKYLISLGGGRTFSGTTETGKENPYSCVVLAGMRSQEERIKNLEHFKNGDTRFLICTDVAARGLDIKNLPYLIMLTLPDDPDNFFHRVGRVGRADNMGLAISIVATTKEKVWYHKCNNRGQGCTNTRLVEHGGCCIWYDEPACLITIEERIGQTIPIMDANDYSIEGIITKSSEKFNETNTHHDCGSRRAEMMRENVVCATPLIFQVAGSMTVYGKSRGGVDEKETLIRLKEIGPRVAELQDIERKIQASFVKLLIEGI